MVLIKTLVELGYVCPNCGSQSLRGAYHEWVFMGTMTCQKCGLKWSEDVDPKQFEKRILQIAERCQTDHHRDGENRFIFVVHTAKHPLNSLLNAGSADGQELTEFKQKGYEYLKSVHNVGDSKEAE